MFVIVKGLLRCGKEFYVLLFKKKILRKWIFVKVLFLLLNFIFVFYLCFWNIFFIFMYILIGGIK